MAVHFGLVYSATEDCEGSKEIYGSSTEISEPSDGAVYRIDEMFHESVMVSSITTSV